MASIRRYDTAKGKKWRVQYRSPDGRSRTKTGFTTKAQAQAWADKNSVSISAGDWTDPTRQKLTVDFLGGRWLENQTHLKPSTYRVVEQAWRVHVQPQWGCRQIGSILPSEVQSWVSALAVERSASTVRRAHGVLAQILDVAVKDGFLKANSARGVQLPRKPRGKHVFLSVEQLGRLADECSRHGELVWLLGTTGLRFGEAAALRVRDVDFLRRRIMVERNAVTVGSAVHIGTPKTHERRIVAVPQFVLGLLDGLCIDKGADELLWARGDGSPLRVPAKDSWYHCALQRVMAADSDFPRVTPHGLRHVAAGLLVSSGANVKVVQRQLGHASAAMTLDVYAELFDADLDVVGAALDEKLSAVVKLSSKRAV